MKEKIKIHEFPLTPYPGKLWIAITTSNMNDYFEELSDFDPDCDAIMNIVVDKDGYRGYLIRFSSLESINFENVAHESFHVVAECCNYIGADIDTNNQEFVAYLIGYIAKCCGEVKNFKED